MLRTVADVREHLRARRGSLGPALSERAIKRVGGPALSERVEGLVPTMGALHDGHVALFRAARRTCTHVVASIFVNPGQFNDPADLAAYPRQEARDAEIARTAGVDTIFAPTVEEMYAPGEATSLVVLGAALGFEGDFRPGHFNSVATVCLKLFSTVQPDVAFFGQKDAQQVAVIRQIVRDLQARSQDQRGADSARSRRPGTVIEEPSTVGRGASSGAGDSSRVDGGHLRAHRGRGSCSCGAQRARRFECRLCRGGSVRW